MCEQPEFRATEFPSVSTSAGRAMKNIKKKSIKIQLHCPHLIWLFSLPNQQALPPCCLLTFCVREFEWECNFRMRADRITATSNLPLTEYCQSTQDDELLSCNVCLANLHIIIVYYIAFWNTRLWLVNMLIQIMKPTRSL